MNKMKVMLVDDEVTVIEGFRQLFNWEKHGFTIVCEANDGVCAVSLANAYQPDIVIMDINIPLLSGLDAIRAMNRNRADTAFIVVSGYDDFEYVREALRLQVVDYMLKPVRFDELSGVLKKVRLELLHLRGQKAETEKPDGKQQGKQVYRIIAYLEEHLAENITLKRLSDEFFLNPSYISQLFKQETGMNYYSYLVLLRMNCAKKLLKTTDLSIAQIACMVGFTDYRTFTQAFKKCTSILPSRYRSARSANSSVIDE